MDNQIWLIDHKATLSDCSPMNLDGSSWILGVCVLSAANQQDAELKFKAFLDNEQMELIEMYQIKEFKTEDFDDDSRRTHQIENAARTVSEDGDTCYVYARTSEFLAEVVKTN